MTAVWDQHVLGILVEAALCTQLFDAVDESIESRFPQFDTGRASAVGRAQSLLCHKTGSNVGPFGACFTWHLIVNLFAHAVGGRGGRHVLFGSMKSIDTVAHQHGRARELIAEYARASWRRSVATSRLAVVTKELKLTPEAGGIVVGALESVPGQFGTIDFATCDIQDASMWPITCSAEVELTTSKASGEPVLHDFRKLFIPSCPHRFFLCRHSARNVILLQQRLDAELALHAHRLRPGDELVMVILPTATKTRWLPVARRYVHAAEGMV